MSQVQLSGFIGWSGVELGRRVELGRVEVGGDGCSIFRVEWTSVE